MDTVTDPALPWEALRNTEDPIPWPALRQFSQALAMTPALLPKLRELLEQGLQDPYEEGRFICLYVPAIIAMAAPGLPEPARKQAAEFFLDHLASFNADDGGDDDDESDSVTDVLSDVFVAACGTLGPQVVLPAVLERMPVNYKPLDFSISLWRLTRLAGETMNLPLRQQVVDFCTKALHAAQDGRVQADNVNMAAWTLAHMKHQASLPLLKDLAEQTGSEEFQEAAACLAGQSTDDHLHPWEEPVKDWFTEYFDVVQARYLPPAGEQLDADSEEEPDDDRDDEAASIVAERRANELARRFDDSPVAKTLPKAMYEHAGFAAYCLLTYAWDYEGCGPEQLSEPVLREVLLEVFPRKISAEADFFKCVVPISQAFLSWLEEEGILPVGKRLAQVIAGWGPEITTRAADPNRWGMAKGFTMLAKSRGVDTSDQHAVSRFALEQSLAQIASYKKKSLPEASDTPPAPGAGSKPFVNATPKTGRNDPCPCGSGKKYKKCCGR